MESLHMHNPTPPASPAQTTFDDVFGDTASGATSPRHDHDVKDDTLQSRRSVLDNPDENARLRRIHVTNGYREGVASAKERFVQAGFDEGFSLGAELGARAGVLLGQLTGLLAALRREVGRGESGARSGEENLSSVGVEANPGKESRSGDGPVSNDPSLEEGDGYKALGSVKQDSPLWRRVKDQVKKAQEELSVQNIFGPAYFDRDGIWRFPVRRKGETFPEPNDAQPNEEVTFREVADSHPLLQKWTADVNALLAITALYRHD